MPLRLRLPVETLRNATRAPSRMKSGVTPDATGGVPNGYPVKRNNELIRDAGGGSAGAVAMDVELRRWEWGEGDERWGRICWGSL